MIVWLNGTFGAGKTTASALLARELPGARVFDSERVGELLMPILADVPCDDFQEWGPWRGLVVETAARVLDYVGGTLIVPQTVLVEEYWDEISTGLAERGIPVAHFVLHADEQTLVQRIHNDPAMPRSQWRMDHLEPYRRALPWLRNKGTIIETGHRTPEQVAQAVASLTSTGDGPDGDGPDGRRRLGDRPGTALSPADDEGRQRCRPGTWQPRGGGRDFTE